MRNIVCFLTMASLLLSLSCKKQSVVKESYIEWSEIYGGSGLDVGNGAAESANGGYIVVGYTNSNDVDVQGQNHCTVFTDVNGKVVQYCGHDDGWILKLSDGGEIIRDAWQRVYGGKDLLPMFSFSLHDTIFPNPNSDRFTAIDAVSRGKFLIAGQTNSSVDQRFFTLANVKWPSRTPFNPTYPWVSRMDETSTPVRTDTMKGLSTYGWYDSVNCIKAFSNGGYALVGFRDGSAISTSIFNSDYFGGRKGGTAEAFIITTPNANTTVPSYNYIGGVGYDRLNAVTKIMDNYLIAVGQTNSSDGDLQGNNNWGGNDLWVIKLNPDGSPVSSSGASRTYGGEGDDIANAVDSTADGGFVVAGQTNSNDGDVSGNHSSRYDAWVIRFNKGGSILWKRTYGGAFGDEKAKSIIQTEDGGFVFVGQTSSNDGDVSGNHGYGDAWVVKLDKDGNIVWQQTLGGSSEDCANNVIATSDGGLLITGYSFSNDGDISRFLAGGNLWVVKLRRQ